eukprot:5437928-Pyramimonas_sp.AAC.1
MHLGSWVYSVPSSCPTGSSEGIAGLCVSFLFPPVVCDPRRPHPPSSSSRRCPRRCTDEAEVFSFRAAGALCYTPDVPLPCQTQSACSRWEETT